jgi:hypothetical protein
MAKIKHGILGPLSGKLGPVIGGVWKGIPYLKMVPDEPKEKKPRSAAQVANEQKFKFGNEWMIPFHPFMEVGFENQAVHRTAISAAFSANYNTIINGTWPDLSVDYSKLVISEGDLPRLLEPLVTLSSPGVVELKWKQSASLGATFDDQIMLVVYSSELGDADGCIGRAIRRDLKCSFEFNPKFIGKPLEIYVGVVSFNRKKIADSEYLGRIEPA